MDPQPRSITLRVTRHDGQPVIAGAHKTFGEHGGTIGRTPQNDWALPDPARFLSSHHATVYFERGAFHLVDCSSNGVFVNDLPQPLGIEHIATLHHGDRLVMGHYEFAVELAGAAPVRPRSLEPLQLLASIDAARAVASPLPPATAVPSTRGASAWADLVTPSLAVDGNDADAIVDPLELLAAPAKPMARRPAPAAQRDDAPLLATPFKPPAVAVPEDWLAPAPLPRPAMPMRRPVTTPNPAQALDQASAALRDALAAIESLKAVVHNARAAADNHLMEATHGLE
jgi:type VI secretion system FHA domain protein